MPLNPSIKRQPAAVGGGSAGSRILLGLFVLGCLLQLIGLYRPTGPPTVDAIPFLDKLGHALVFALPVAMILLYPASRTGRGWSGVFGVVVILIFAGHAVVSELLQAWLLPERSGDPYDVLADLTGIAIGYGTAVLIQRRRPGDLGD
ncbi:VanZ family protein [Microlunatus speluncae]|uniref:VanZ family protein n=1 Tax=Microlunatus speluncae TaxID=2594267 RepID=UPI001375C88D|nr:VanZ family protein [Microlunatus speluncae]